MHSSTSSFERPVPDAPWKSAFLAVVVLSLLATLGWELYVRSQGYLPTLNDSAYLWADERDKLQDDSLVLIGASRTLFNIDLDILESGLGQKPVQLAITGASFYPVLQNLVEETDFKGTLLIGVVPPMLPVPGGPLLDKPVSVLKLWQTRSPSERFSQKLAMFLEERIAFMKEEDLTLSILLKKLPIPNRPQARVAPSLPPYFATVDRNRRYRMIEAAEKPGELQSRIQQIWLPLFSPPPPPSYVDPEAFMKEMIEGGKAHFGKVVELVKRAQERGCKVIFIRHPSTGTLRELERQGSPREQIWEPLLQMTQAPGIHFEDHAELADFDCPEWSHLSNEGSIEYTRRLIPHLKAALQRYD